MIIGSCGYGGTGSSVLTDLLREYDDVQVYDEFEYILSYRVDGIQDLEYHLMKQFAKNLSGDYAIKRFMERSKCYKIPFIHKPCGGKEFYQISKEFIDEITQLTYRGMDTADVLTGHLARDIFAFASKKFFMPKIIEKLIKQRSYLWPCRTMYYSIHPSNFYEAAKRYNNKIIEAMGADLNRPVCLDQPFEGNNPENSFPFFEDPYAVVLDRDPRDLYFDIKYTKSPDGKFVPHTTVEDFIVFYSNMRSSITEHPRVLRLNFEELIYNYDKAVNKIEAFLHLGEHIRPRTLFNPSRSINNTQMIRLHPEDKEDIQKIEIELKEFLFPYENYPAPKFNGKPFSGAGRKMVTFE